MLAQRPYGFLRQYPAFVAFLEARWTNPDWSTTQAAIDTLSSQVAQEQEAALEPRIVARSATEPIVECSADSRVVARGSVIAVDDYWQIEGLSQCSLRPAPAK